MDGYELNKIFGALVGALGVLVALNIVTGAMFAPPHHGDDHKLAFSMPIEDDAPAVEETVVEATPLPVLLASADVGAGERVFRKCQSCHAVGEGAANKTGPHLQGVMGRKIGAVGDFAYSAVLAEHGGVWDWDAMNGFLKAPKDWAPGTKMAYAGLRSDDERVNLMAWLNTFSDPPLEIPAAE